jgi:hypothetical protein
LEFIKDKQAIYRSESWESIDNHPLPGFDFPADYMRLVDLERRSIP